MRVGVGVGFGKVNVLFVQILDLKFIQTKLLTFETWVNVLTSVNVKRFSCVRKAT